MKTKIFGALTFFIALLLVSALTVTLFVIPSSASVPTAPRNLVATKYTGYVTLDWDAPAEGDSGILEYKIYRAESVFPNPLLLEWGYLASTTETILTHDPLPPIHIPPPTFYNDTNISTSGGISVHYYWYKVSAVNADGTGVDSTAVRADPPPDVTVPATITNLATSNPTGSSIDLSWTAPGDDGSTGTATTYDIRYRTDAAITNANWATATQVTGEPGPKSGGSNETFTVTGLAASTTYYFAIKTADEVPNWSPISNSPHETTLENQIFDTNASATPYPSIPGTHHGTITASHNFTIIELYTHPCPGTGGHTEYVKIWRGSEVIAEKTWNGYTGDWHNLTFNNSFTLYANETYNYTIRTGSYPQIIHEPSYNATGGKITCKEFVDINGKRHEGWIPAIRLS